MAHDTSPADRIRALLHDRTSTDDRKRQRAAHDLMLEGCAHALRLEAERMRIGRKVERLADLPDDPDSMRELRGLWLELNRSARELEDLRGLLALLRPLATRPLDAYARSFRTA